METIEFLSAVLPTQGTYCVFTVQGISKKNIFVDDLENLYNTNRTLSATGAQTYFALATFDEAGTRKAVHALWIRALFIDLDCGRGKAFASKKEAVTALVKFMAASGMDTLGQPWLVDSGGGVHAYWPFHNDTPIDMWQPLAEALKRVSLLT